MERQGKERDDDFMNKDPSQSPSFLEAGTVCHLSLYFQTTTATEQAPRGPRTACCTLGKVARRGLPNVWPRRLGVWEEQEDDSFRDTSRVGVLHPLKWLIVLQQHLGSKYPPPKHGPHWHSPQES